MAKNFFQSNQKNHEDNKFKLEHNIKQLSIHISSYLGAAALLCGILTRTDAGSEYPNVKNGIAIITFMLAVGMAIRDMSEHCQLNGQLHQLRSITPK